MNMDRRPAPLIAAGRVWTRVEPSHESLERRSLADSLVPRLPPQPGNEANTQVAREYDHHARARE